MSDPASSDTASAATIEVEIAYADQNQQILQKLQIRADISTGEVLKLPEVLALLPAGFVPKKIGIFSRRVDERTLLKKGDRLEIYRELNIDPKDARRQRARQHPSK